MSTETTNKKIKIDNGTTFGRTYTDKAIDAKLPTDLIASANKLSLGVGNAPLGNGVNLSGFTYDEATKTLKASGADTDIPSFELEAATERDRVKFGCIDLYKHTLTETELTLIKNGITNNHPILGKAIIDSTKYVSLLQPYVQDLTNNVIGGDCGTGIQVGFIFSIITLKWIIFGDTLYVGSFFQVTLNYGLKISSYKLSMGVGNVTINSPSVYFSTINGQCVCKENESETKNYTFTEDKTISLFGKHSILVPKDSTETNIDLYNHYIRLTANGTDKGFLLLFLQSSNNLKATSLTNLNTLIGTGIKPIQCNGFYNVDGTKKVIGAFQWHDNFASSEIYVDGGTTVTGAASGYTLVDDTVETV